MVTGLKIWSHPILESLVPRTLHVCKTPEAAIPFQKCLSGFIVCWYRKAPWHEDLVSNGLHILAAGCFAFYWFLAEAVMVLGCRSKSLISSISKGRSQGSSGWELLAKIGKGVLGVCALQAFLPVRHHTLSQHTITRTRQVQCQCSSHCSLLPACSVQGISIHLAKRKTWLAITRAPCYSPFWIWNAFYVPCGHGQISPLVTSPVLQAVPESEGFVALLCNLLVPCTLLVTRVRPAVNVMWHRKAPLSKTS